VLGQARAKRLQRGEQAGERRPVTGQRRRRVGERGHGVGRGLHRGLEVGGPGPDGFEPRRGPHRRPRRRLPLLDPGVHEARAREQQRRGGEDGDGGAGAEG